MGLDARKNVRVVPSLRQKVGLDSVLPPREECNWIVIYEFRTSNSQHSENNNFINPGRRRTRMEVVILICIQIAYLTFLCFPKKLPRAVLECILLFIL